MAKLTDDKLIKELIDKYGWTREETINGYGVFYASGSSTVLEDVAVIEVIGDLQSEFDYGFTNGDWSACRQAEADGVKFINDIDGLERGCYIDTPENRAECERQIREFPECRVENWLFKDECSEEYRTLYIEKFGNPLGN